MVSLDGIETQFYEALQQGDLERLMRLWADEEDITCVHPGGPRESPSVLHWTPWHPVPPRS